MTIQQLRCFVTAARLLNIRRAAEELFLSQPAVTHHIHALEEELDTQLFLRENRQIRLTEPGRIFFIDAVDILERISLSVEHVHQRAVNGTVLHISCESTMQMSHITDIYREFRAEFPDVFISNTESAGKDRRGLLKDGNIDIALLPDDGFSEDAGIRFCALYEGQHCCIVPCTHPFAEKEYVTAEDFAGETLILLDAEHSPPENDRVQRYLQLHCPDTEFCFSGSSLYTVPMIEAGIGIAVMPDCVCPKSENVVPVPYRPKSIVRFGIAWHRANETNAVRRFIEITCRRYGQPAPHFS